MRFTRLLFGLALAGLVLGVGARVDAADKDKGDTQKLVPVIKQASHFGVSRPARDIQMPAAPVTDKVEQRLASPNPPIRAMYDTRKVRRVDGALQATPRVPVDGPNVPATTLTFEGTGVADDGVALGIVMNPPDPNGDVGPDHYVEGVNVLVEVFDKAGTSLAGPFTISSLFAGFGGDPAGCESDDDGDPIILYDHLADRWLLSQFRLNIGPGPFFQCVAISQTPDPAGAYYLYEYEDPNNNFADYPHYGVWPDGYYMTVNEFNAAGTAFVAGGNHVFERQKMLAGDPTASYIYFQTPSWAGGLPSDLDGPPPPAGTPNTFAFLDTNAIVLFDFAADWTTPANSTFTQVASVDVAPFTWFNPTPTPGDRKDIPQPPPAVIPTHNLDGIGDRLMHRLQYRNFGTSETLVGNFTVDADPGAGARAAPRVFALRDSGSGFLPEQQITYAPGTDYDDRWMGSAAMDAAGNILVGYSISSASVFPSIYYTGRAAGDPPNTLQTEASMWNGTSSQETANNRWGDYTGLSVDPVDDCTFWYVNEYYIAGESLADNVCGPFTNSFGYCWHTRIGQIAAFPGCVPAPTGEIAGTVLDGSAAPVAGALVSADGYSTLSQGDGSYSMIVAPGTYSMTASKAGYTPDSATGVSVGAGGTTTQNFTLIGVPMLELDSVSVDDSARGNGNGLIDPGECVDVTITLRNAGAATATGISGALSTPTAGAGVYWNQATSDYPDIVASSTGSNTVAFAVSTDSGFAGGTPIDLVLDVTSNEGPYQFNTQVETNTGAQGFSTTTPVPIPNTGTPGEPSTPVDSPVDVIDVSGSIGRIEVDLHITHTYDSDLIIDLVAPDGTTIVRLATQVGGGGDDFGTGCPTGEATTFRDDAATPIGDGSAPFVGTFQPEGTLADFLALGDLNGTWNLRVQDQWAEEDSGTIECWGIRFVPSTVPPGPGSCEDLEIFADGFESGDVSAWSNALP